jgi:hypothetical protein
MHLLPNMATEADNVLRIFEDVALLAKETQFSFKTDESGTARLVRTANKILNLLPRYETIFNLSSLPSK